MDGWRDGREKEYSCETSYHVRIVVEGESGWDEDGPTSELEGIQKINVAGVTHHMLTRRTRHLQAK